VSLDLEALLERVTQDLYTSRPVFLDATGEEVLTVSSESQFTETHMLFILDLDLQDSFRSYLSRLNLSDNSISTTSIDDRVLVRVILSHLDVSEISAACLLEGLAVLQLPVRVALFSLLVDARAVKVP
jgi:hypothetical protein